MTIAKELNPCIRGALPYVVALDLENIFNTEIGSGVVAYKKKGMSIQFATDFLISLLTIIHLSVIVHSTLICCIEKPHLWSQDLH